MSDIITELNKHLAETKQRFDELEHAMIALADLVEQLMEKNAKKEDERRRIHKVQSKTRRRHV